MTLLRFDTEVYESLSEFANKYESECREVFGAGDADKIIEKAGSDLEAIRTVLDELDSAFLLDYDGGTEVFLVHVVSEKALLEAAIPSER